MDNDMGLGRWLVLMARSLIAGAGAGTLAGSLIFFGFGFIGLTGGDLAQRAENGWEAVWSFGLQRGFVLGMGIAVALMAAFVAWRLVAGDVRPQQARRWLTAVAALVMVVGNADVMRVFGGWDEVAILTVVLMALVAAMAVWLVVPWVLRSSQ